MGALRRFWTSIIHTLREERGDVELGDDELSAEELKILGEDEKDEFAKDKDDKTGGDDEDKTGGDDEDDDAGGGGDDEDDKGGDDEDKTPVQKRIDELVGKAGESDRKLDLFKTLGPEGYYKVYPGEKPEGYEEKGGDQESKHQGKPLSFGAAANMVVKGGAYDGKTLAEVKEENPDDALDLYLEWRDDQKDEAKESEIKTEALNKEVGQELSDFENSLSKDLFGKDDVAGLDEKQADEVKSIVGSILDWMDETNRFNYKLEDAYYILNKENILNDAKGKAVSDLINKLRSGSGSVVGAKKGSSGAKTGYEALENMNADELAVKIENMSDGEYDSFRNNAPASLKSKFPGIDWD